MRGSTTVVVSDLLDDRRPVERHAGLEIVAAEDRRIQPLTEMDLARCACGVAAPARDAGAVQWRSTRLRLPSTVVRTLMIITGMPASVLPNSAL